MANETIGIRPEVTPTCHGLLKGWLAHHRWKHPKKVKTDWENHVLPRLRNLPVMKETSGMVGEIRTSCLNSPSLTNTTGKVANRIQAARPGKTPAKRLHFFRSPGRRDLSTLRIARDNLFSFLAETKIKPSGNLIPGIGTRRRELTGTFIVQATLGEEVRAFLPKPLPPDPPLAWTPSLLLGHQKASTALGRLDGVTTLLPDPTLFLYSYVRKEAVLSSQIEGTQSSLSDQVP